LIWGESLNLALLPSATLASLLQRHDVYYTTAVASWGTHATVTKELCQTEFFHSVLDGG
jgi:hypothetical protein